MGINPDDGDPSNDVPENIPKEHSYLNKQQQAAVKKYLGKAYDPAKPLNVQLFKARWSGMTQDQRRTFAKQQAGAFLEGGPSVKTLSQFHNTYMEELRAQNDDLQSQYKESLANYQASGGGGVMTQAMADADVAYWNEFAASPEGAAHIASTGLSTEDFIARQTESSASQVENYQSQKQQFGRIQNIAARAGMEVPGFTPPGWEGTVEAIQKGGGNVNLPSAAYQAMFPGIASSLASLPQYNPNASVADNPLDLRTGEQAGNSGGGSFYQPFTGMTGVQQPNSFSERDLYQESQNR